jgi:hypothetical protein
MTEAGREDEKKRWMSKIDDEDGIFGGSGGSVYVADCIILVTVYVYVCDIFIPLQLTCVHT